MTDDEHFPDGSTRTEGETLDMPEGLGVFGKGQVLGERYQILELLGRGGMGEVWHAFDLKLRVEVALKALRPEFFTSERRLELLRQEVRAAREVVSPNVCRIFDLIEIEGRELVSMEYVDGATLLAVLQERGPLELKEAQDIASQFLAGLEAIHKVGLIHRDIKPENIMLTRAGRVVVMDFGLARQETEGGGSVSGTPAYMAPEQAAGQTLDARADVYAAGVVLAEMVCPEGIKNLQSRQSVWEGVRSSPAKVPDTPWAPVIQRAVARDRERRQNSAHTLIRELEDVTLRVEGAEDLHPYPGLASFTEEDAEYFFGREAEVEQMWRKLEGPPRMLSLVGPSGAGKSSLLRAGLLPARRHGWAYLVVTPGEQPFANLGGAATRALTDDLEALEMMVRFTEPEVAVEVLRRWRQQHEHSLLVVDQFEELFTLNPDNVRASFSNLLGRLPLEVDVHVLVSMRDDFLGHCHAQAALSPVFSDLTYLGTPTGGALRRAMVQPATTCGYRFEDDDLIEEILAEVEGERGALPSLAFALAKLWDERDRETGLLTGLAYHDIGGVGGALAQHAEATIDQIGHENLPIVRELFRNLVTAEGTRAVREWDELLSIFRDSHSESRAEEVLRALIDARLLTSYEVREEDKAPTRRVEIIHESLLSNWPRLVHWQTQDQEGAQLRDELRLAARAWDEHGRPDDRLWTGTAFREYRLWRERYPGGLSDVEEAFTAATIIFAGRRRRRRRIAAAAGVSFLIAVLAVVTGLWRRSLVHERRAEAQKLVALGNLAMDDHPTAALVHATRSLELADSDEGRFLALRALWEGPTAFIVNNDSSNDGSFSPDGSWLVQSPWFSRSGLRVISRSGLQRVVDVSTVSPETSSFWTLTGLFAGPEDLFISFSHSGGTEGTVALWSAPEARLLAWAKPIDQPDGWPWAAGGISADRDRRRAVFALKKDELVTVHALHTNGDHEPLGTVTMAHRTGSVCSPRISGEWVGIVDGNEVSVVGITKHGLSDPLPLGRHEGELLGTCWADPLGRGFATFDRAGEIRFWDVSDAHQHVTITGPPHPVETGLPAFTRDGSHLIVPSTRDRRDAEVWIWAVDDFSPRLLRRFEGVEWGRGFGMSRIGPWLAMTGPLPAHRLFSLRHPAGAEPLLLRHGPVANIISKPVFSPDGRWLATTDTGGLTFWPLSRPYPAVIRNGGGAEFGPAGRFLVTAVIGTVSLIPLEGPVPSPGRILLEADGVRINDVEVSPDGRWVAASSQAGRIWMTNIESGESRILAVGSLFLSFSPDGRKLALSEGRIVDLEDVFEGTLDTRGADRAREVEVTNLPGDEFYFTFCFTGDGSLLTGTRNGLVAWDVETGDRETLVEGDASSFAASADGRRLLMLDFGGEGYLTQDPTAPPAFFDLDTGATTTLSSHGLRVWSMAMDRDGTVAVTGDRNGIVRVGPVTGEEPHLLLGHEENDIFRVAVDPTGRWIASSSFDGTVRLWPMPDLSKPPLHTLPRNELIALLKTLTNLRLERDPESGTGWTLTHEPFQGWEKVPTW